MDSDFKFDIRYLPALSPAHNPSQVLTYSAMPDNFTALPITLDQLDTWEAIDNSVRVFNLHWDEVILMGVKQG